VNPIASAVEESSHDNMVFVCASVFFAHANGDAPATTKSFSAVPASGIRAMTVLSFVRTDKPLSPFEIAATML
jgi:hypothetical protein